MKTPSTMDQDELPYKVKFTVEQYTAPHDIVISGVAPRALYGILKNISNNFDFSVGFKAVFWSWSANGVVECPVLHLSSGGIASSGGVAANSTSRAPSILLAMPWPATMADEPLWY
jgi:hypothetical protein